MKTILSELDFRAIELRIAAQLSGKDAGDLVILDEVPSPLEELVKRIKVEEPMPVEYRTRRSKGDKHRNRRHRWS